MFCRSEKIGVPSTSLQRVGRQYEAVGAALPIVPVVLDVAEPLLGQEIEITVGVHVREAVPLSHVDVAVPGALRDEAGQAVALTIALEEGDAAGHFLEEQVEIAVTVGVHQLGPRGVEAAVERQLERAAGGVHHREGRDDVAIPEPALLGRRRPGHVAATGCHGEEEGAGESGSHHLAMSP